MKRYARGPPTTIPPFPGGGSLSRVRRAFIKAFHVDICPTSMGFRARVQPAMLMLLDLDGISRCRNHALDLELEPWVCLRERKTHPPRPHLSHRSCLDHPLLLQGALAALPHSPHRSGLHDRSHSRTALPLSRTAFKLSRADCRLSRAAFLLSGVAVSLFLAAIHSRLWKTVASSAPNVTGKRKPRAKLNPRLRRRSSPVCLPYESGS
jgi:hypothetical protein